MGLWNYSKLVCTDKLSIDGKFILQSSLQVYNLNFSSDGKFVLACTGKPAEIVTWKFFNFKEDQTVQENEYPVLFKGQGRYHILWL